jgi:sulfite reductase beta subunit-like hemoprotein
LDQGLLADPILAELPPKFSMALDGGGRWFSDEIDDLALRAFRAKNAVLWLLSIGGTSTGLAVATEKAVACLLEAARSCLRASSEFGIAARGRAFAADPAAWKSAVSELSRPMVPFAPPQIFRRAADAPIGLVESRHNHFVHLVPSIPLGRLSAHQAREIAAVAADRELDLRLAPWRGIVVGCVPKQDAAHVAGLLGSMGLSMDGTDGYRGISACAGITGCDASLADVRKDAAALARMLAGRVPKAGWRVNVAGCEKQCAMRRTATVQLVAGETGYRMTLNETSVSTGYSADRAIAAIASLHASLPSEVSR